jgi:23S rRNA (guanosine2251-2'-O)-methyltransferase
MKKLTMDELDRLSVEDFKEKPKAPLAVVLDNVRSLNNVGSAFRTSDAFLVEKICLCGITGRPPHREIQKTALGATESVAWEYHETTLDAIKKLKEEGFKICVFEQVDQSLFLHEFIPEDNAKYALVFGNEVFGVDENVIHESQFILEIPQLGTKHSFNISVSIGIALWDFASKLALLTQVKR